MSYRIVLDPNEKFYKYDVEQKILFIWSYCDSFETLEDAKEFIKYLKKPNEKLKKIVWLDDNEL